jgi:hypothetical protein
MLMIVVCGLLQLLGGKNFVRSTLLSLAESCRCNNSPPFLLKNNCFSLITFLLLINLYNHNAPIRSNINPRTDPHPEKPAYKESSLFNSSLPIYVYELGNRKKK